MRPILWSYMVDDGLRGQRSLATSLAPRGPLRAELPYWHLRTPWKTARIGGGLCGRTTAGHSTHSCRGKKSLARDVHLEMMIILHFSVTTVTAPGRSVQWCSQHGRWIPFVQQQIYRVWVRDTWCHCVHGWDTFR